jgi:hypothetical protein
MNNIPNLFYPYYSRLKIGGGLLICFRKYLCLSRKQGILVYIPFRVSTQNQRLKLSLKYRKQFFETFLCLLFRSGQRSFKSRKIYLIEHFGGIVQNQAMPGSSYMFLTNLADRPPVIQCGRFG